MTNYRRPNIPGATWFTTVTLAERAGNQLLVDQIELFRLVVLQVKTRHPFRIDAMVVLPEHIHAIWTLPETDSDLGMRWNLIKSGFSRRLPKGEIRSISRITRGERGVWQRRFWEHQIRNEADLNAHMDYVHFNPVKHGWVKRVADWPHSSFHRLLAQGFYPSDWGSVAPGDLTSSGE